MHTPTFRRYVALGDSLVEGVGDDCFDQDRFYAGWSDRLAVLLNKVAQDENSDFLYANLAVRSRNSEEILTEQVAQALALEPDFVTIMAGANDLWRPRRSWDSVRENFAHAIAQFQAAGATVLLTNCINPIHHWSLQAGTQRSRELTALIEDVAQEYGVDVVDVHRSPTLRRLRVWSEDRVHFGPRGHAHVANKAAKKLGLPYRMEAPLLHPKSRDTMSLWEHIVWIYVHVSPFVARRIRGIAAGDGINPKRPVLSRVHDHPWTIRYSQSSPVVKVSFAPASLVAE